MPPNRLLASCLGCSQNLYIVVSDELELDFISDNYWFYICCIASSEPIYVVGIQRES